MELGSSSKGHENFRGLFMKKGGWDLPNKFFCSQRKIRKSTQTKKHFLHIFHKNVMHIEVDVLSKIVLHS